VRKRLPRAGRPGRENNPAPFRSPVTFNETLAALLELIGQRVSISAAGIDGDPPMALTVTGTLAEGTELLRDRADAGEGDEAFYLSFEEDRGSGFLVHSKDFRGARWAGPILEITVGGVLLRVEPESGS
jgi:hypothetical protein